MGLLSVDLLVKLQILPGFFSNCLFLAVYDSMVLLKQAGAWLSCVGPPCDGHVPRMLTMEGMQSVWQSYLLDVFKRVKLGGQAPNSRVVRVSEKEDQAAEEGAGECHLLDFASPGRPLVVNFGSAT
ncbi:hypothetical protein scyTo_0007720 [Scyliorhinus torazame]|uniref:Iodothyronine deiodinase n=1 Tax=Scyliorhinus torazame TaxID=75743 RepID=A0A401NX62_SCYTO|nr:hypothetical protein [Scyliorhinus torazame]